MDDLRIKLLLEDPTTSTWLKQALTTALRRDPVDAVYDAEVLTQTLRRRLVQIQGPRLCDICQKDHNHA